MAHQHTIVVLTPVCGGPFYGEVLTGLSREVRAAGGHVVVVQSSDAGRARDDLSGPASLPPIGWANAAGVVAITRAAPRGYLERLSGGGTPVVLVSDVIDGLVAPTVAPDNAGAARAAVDHLVGHGHTRIGFAANLLQADLRERYAAYRAALAEHGLDSDPSLLYPAPDNTEAGGRRAAEAIVSAGVPLTAVIAGNDRNALGLVEALEEAGVLVPSEVAVIGFDDVEHGAFSSPALTTISLGFDRVGALAGRLVLSHARGEQVDPVAHRPASRLVPRHSCGCQSDHRTATGAAAAGAAPAPPGFTGLVELVREAVSSGSVVPAARIDGFVDGLEGGSTPPDDLNLAVADLTDRLAAAVGPELDDHGWRVVARTAGHVGAALWRAKASTYLARVAGREQALVEQYEVGMAMLDEGSGDPRSLDWMEVTQAVAGCLALWEDHPGEGRLRVAGTYRTDRRLPVRVDEVVPVEEFPPAALLDGGGFEPDEVVFVVPVRADGVDWGLLAVVGQVDATSTSARDIYNQWAALLAVALGRAALHESVRRSEERYGLAAEATHDGLWDWNLTQGTVFYSARCGEMFGHHISGGTAEPTVWFDAVHPDDLHGLQLGLLAAAEGADESIEVEHRVRGRDGSYRYVLCRAIAVPDETGRVARLVGSLTDIHQRKQLEEQLRRGALYDDVTTLPNRRLFLERLSFAIAQSRRIPERSFAVLFLDLDGFKHVNDSLGHQAGDQLLASVGERLRVGLRDVDIAARFGGDEFAVLLHDIDPSVLPGVVARLQERIAQPVDLSGSTVTVTASVGTTTSAVGYADEDDVLRDADMAMYHAKSRRRGSHVAFDPAIHSPARAVTA